MSKRELASQCRAILQIGAERIAHALKTTDALGITGAARLSPCGARSLDLLPNSPRL